MLKSFGWQAISLALLLNVGCVLAQNATVSGVAKTVSGVGIPGISVQVSETSTNTVIADLDFVAPYTFTLPLGGSYTITPEKNDNHVNGVTTFDLVLLSRHLSGEQPFTSPYQYIAADADANGILDLNDSLEIRNVILGIYTEFPNNTSWRFIPADYIFPNPLQPFPFPEVVTTGTLTANLSGVDFVGVKVGDVNGTSLPGGTSSNYSSVITGTVKFDQNSNCIGDATEPALSGWMLTARNGSNEYYATTHNNGGYELYAPQGNYDVWLKAPNPLWDICPDTIFGLQLSTFDTDTILFTASAQTDCPLMEVELSTPFLRRCFDNNYYIVHYCNNGTVTAENAHLDVAFDPYFSISASSLPWSGVNGNTYNFDLGDVPAGYCGDFIVLFTLSCDATLGQTHCTTAHIFPDTLCDTQAWGGDLELVGACSGDDVVFTVTNHGLPMTEAVDYVVIEDVMVQLVSNNSIQLNANESQTITVPANGSTWRLEVGQPVGYPWNTVTSTAVEGCGENSQGVFSLGFVTQFPNNDDSPFEDEDCLENIGSYDPNDKQGFPHGISEEHFVKRDQEMEYVIRFQNTGTDTAFTVIVLDSLSALLNPATVRPLGSSHPFTWQIIDGNVLQFFFQNILLPDSNVNEAASNGYLKFAIAPKTGLPDGTVIENEAAIFFDFNLPIITNRTWHTLGTQFLRVNNVASRPAVPVELWPNPTSAKTTFSLQSPTILQGRLRVFDALGRSVSTQDFTENKFEWNAAGLMPGLYYFRLETTDGEGMATGSVSVMR